MHRNMGIKMAWTLLFAIVTLIHTSQGSLEDTFNDYDIVNNLRVHSITKRDTVSPPMKKVVIPAFGKNYTVDLEPSKDLFMPRMKIVVIHGDGTSDEIKGFNKNNFFTGHLEGDPNSKASIHMDDAGVATGVFNVGNEEFFVEPVTNHLNESEKWKHEANSMVVYRRKDLKEDPAGPSLCGAKHPTEDTNEDEFDQIKFKSLNEDGSGAYSRKKRATVPKSCRLLLVADYKFYGHLGQSNIFTTANYMIVKNVNKGGDSSTISRYGIDVKVKANMINRANLIYRATVFGGMGNAFGFEIEKMVIHDGPSVSDAQMSLYPYNLEKTNWGTSELLESFGYLSENSDFCLGHLFTSQRMPDSILGLAYIASSRVDQAGGICSPSFTVGGRLRNFNVGWTTSRNLGGNTVSFTQMSLVTSHEFGHNWGSEHDPSSGSCAPGTFFDDGKYLMYAYSVTGEDPNNDDFSSCSRGSIGAVLSVKAASCFQETSPESLCGNGRIDSGEECDGGFLGKVSLDPCCNQDCTLASGAICSPSNYPCCRNCQLASPGILCSGLVEGSCHEESFCDGTTLTCPDPPNKADETACLDGGSCLSGVCLSFCEFRGFNSCVCDNVGTSCLRCCRNNAGQCSVFDNNVLLADGRSCVQGYCENGLCIKVATDLVERFWEFIDQVDFDFIAESFKTNMVSCVTGFSLLIYIPICIVIWCVDKKRKKDWENQNAVHVRTDRGLSRDDDKRPVVTEKSKPTRSHPVTLDPSEFLSTSHRSQRSHVSSRNQIQPLKHKPGASNA